MSLCDRIYGFAPLPLQHALVSLKGWQLRHQRGDDALIRRHLAALLESQWWDAERFRDEQHRALRRHLAYAFAHVPYYRALSASFGAGPEEIRTLDDFRKLPILEKSEVRGRESEFLSDDFDPRRCTRFFTSGTTGTPMTVYESRQSWSLRQAFVCRLRSWAGLGDPFYPRRVQFTGRGVVPDRQRPSCHVYWRRNGPGRSLVASSVHISPETIPHYVDAFVRFQPALMDGFPSAFLAIARVGLRLGLELPRPQAVITTSETLAPEHRQEIEEAFGCPVYDQYAATESCCFWGTCEHGQMHVGPEYGISEILTRDGRPAAPGEEGDVVTTSFLSPAMPLIRYRIGDRAVAGPEEPCPCGRHMPRVATVTGRVEDVIYVPERGYIARLDPAFKGLPGIVEAQIIQETLDRLRVLLVPAADYRPEVGEHLVRNLRSRVGSAVAIRIELVERIPRGANGKFRAIVSTVMHLYPDRM